MNERPSSVKLKQGQKHFIFLSKGLIFFHSVSLLPAAILLALLQTLVWPLFSFSPLLFAKNSYDVWRDKHYFLNENSPRKIFSRQTQTPESSVRVLPDSIYKREEITVVLIDSGLGGLSIMAEAASRLEKAKIYRQVNLVFFNALFSKEGGYNTLPTREARVDMLDRVLVSLTKKLTPDLILIACNTLSTLYPATRFSQTTETPVLDIIQPGVNLLSEQLTKQPEAVAIIFATPVTINEDTHRKRLLGQGIAPGRLIVQACPELELFIEKNPAGEETAMLISGYLDEALSKIPSGQQPVIISLNCTHYGYAISLWEKAAQESGFSPWTIVNPNSALIDLWIKPDIKPRYSRSKIEAACYSRVLIEKETREIIASYLKKVSAITASALLNCLFDPALF